VQWTCESSHSLSVRMAHFFFFFWCGTGDWTTLPALFIYLFIFWWWYFQDTVSQTVCLGWLQATLLLLCANGVARITGVNHWRLTRMAHILKTENNKCWQESKTTQTPYYFWQEGKWYIYFRKHFGRFLKSYICLCLTQANQFLHICLR
jgi:hypothetical protein